MDQRADTRRRIVDVAALLLHDHGAAAVTTRGVAEKAGVQAPTIYRLFGDKDGLLEAVAEHTMATFVSAKARAVAAETAADFDPVEDLRVSWERQLEFSLANPAVYRLLSEPARALQSPAIVSGLAVLRSRVHRLALAGRLRVDEERAAALIQAAGTGATQLLLATPPDRRDPGVADALFEAVLQQILTDAPPPTDPGPRPHAVALRAVTPQLDMLTSAEQHLMTEWLDRAIAAL